MEDNQNFWYLSLTIPGDPWGTISAIPGILIPTPNKNTKCSLNSCSTSLHHHLSNHPKQFILRWTCDSDLQTSVFYSFVEPNFKGVNKLSTHNQNFLILVHSSGSQNTWSTLSMTTLRGCAKVCESKVRDWATEERFCQNWLCWNSERLAHKCLYHLNWWLVIKDVCCGQKTHQTYRRIPQIRSIQDGRFLPAQT
jgi:hypothetical protein